MTEAMPFLQKTILLSYDPRPLAGGMFLVRSVGKVFAARRFLGLFRVFGNQRRLGRSGHRRKKAGLGSVGHLPPFHKGFELLPVELLILEQILRDGVQLVDVGGKDLARFIVAAGDDGVDLLDRKSVV